MNNKTLLVAISDVFFYTKLRDAVKSRGYTMEKARSQDDLVEKASRLQPAGIVLNLNDQSLDAFKALEAIKGDERSKSIPILAFANHEEVDNWRHAQSLGVSKVVSRNEFSSRTLELIERMIGS